MRLTIHVIIYSLALLMVFALLFLNMLYLKEMRKAKRVINIEAPPAFLRMLKVAIGLSTGTIATIVLFLLYELITA